MQLSEEGPACPVTAGCGVRTNYFVSHCRQFIELVRRCKAVRWPRSKTEVLSLSGNEASAAL